MVIDQNCVFASFTVDLGWTVCATTAESFWRKTCLKDLRSLFMAAAVLIVSAAGVWARRLSARLSAMARPEPRWRGERVRETGIVARKTEAQVES